MTYTKINDLKRHNQAIAGALEWLSPLLVLALSIPIKLLSSRYIMKSKNSSAPT